MGFCYNYAGDCFCCSYAVKSFAALTQVTVSAENMWVTIFIAIMQVEVSVAIKEVAFSAVTYVCKIDCKTFESNMSGLYFTTFVNILPELTYFNRRNYIKIS